MTHHITPADLARVARASETLLTPLAHPDVHAWGEAVMRELGPLLGADQMLFAVPIQGHAELRGEGPTIRDAIAAYLAHYHTVDFAFNRRRRARGLEIYPAALLYEPGEQERTELFNDWCVPYRLCDALGMSVQYDEGTLPAGVHFYHERAGIRPFGERETALLALLLPAFKAGVRTVRQATELRGALLQVVDAQPGAIALFDADARPLHENPPMRALRQSVADEWGLGAALGRLARGAAGLLKVRKSGAGRNSAVPSEEVATNVGQVQLSATWVPVPGLPAPVVMVVAERRRAQRMEPAQVQRCFGLTPRQLEVALLLRDGMSNAGIAERLEISTHTAERHTEEVLRKLGVRSRAAVGATLTI